MNSQHQPFWSHFEELHGLSLEATIQLLQLHVLQVVNTLDGWDNILVVVAHVFGHLKGAMREVILLLEDNDVSAKSTLGRVLEPLHIFRVCQNVNVATKKCSLHLDLREVVLGRLLGTILLEVRSLAKVEALETT